MDTWEMLAKTSFYNKIATTNWYCKRLKLYSSHCNVWNRSADLLTIPVIPPYGSCPNLTILQGTLTCAQTTRNDFLWLAFQWYLLQDISCNQLSASNFWQSLLGCSCHILNGFKSRLLWAVFDIVFQTKIFKRILKVVFLRAFHKSFIFLVVDMSPECCCLVILAQLQSFSKPLLYPNCLV